MEEEKKECCWVLEQLWAPNSMFYTKVRLLDTLINDPSSPTGFRWLFTDHKGEVKKHGAKNAGIELILKSFLSKALESSNSCGYSRASAEPQKSQERAPEAELYTATLITENEYDVLIRQKAISHINQRGLGTNCALQQFIYPYKELHVRYQIISNAVDGRFVYSFFRVNINDLYDEKKKPEPIRAGEMCRKMQEMEEEVRTVLERNTSKRVLKLGLLFLLDHERNLWLSGSTACSMASPEAFQELFRSPSKAKKINQSPLTHRLQSTQSIGTFRGSVYLPTQASVAHTYRSFPTHPHPRFAKCGGDFCNFVLTELKSLQRGEVDYDDLIKVIRTAYSSDGQTEAMNIKLAIAVDFLSKERSKLKPKRVVYNIPNRYVILGRQLMKRSHWKENWEVGDQLEIDLTPLIQLGGRLYLLQNEIDEIERCGQSQPFFYYNTVKVCGRCYPIYLTIRKAHINALAAAAHPIPTPPIAMPRLSRATTSYLTRRASIRSVETETIVTSLGKINKNNLNDLLVDMRFAQQEEGLDSQRVRSELSHMYRDMTEGERRKKEEEKKKEAQERANVIEPKRVEGHSLEQDLTLRFFPAENTKSLRVFDEKTRNKEKWKQFLDKKKHVRPTTSSCVIVSQCQVGGNY